MWHYPKFDTVYTDGSHYKFTKTDTITLAADFVRATPGKAENDTLLRIAVPRKDNAGTDTLDIKLKSVLAKDQKPAKTDVIVVAATKKSVKPSVVKEKTVGSGTFWTFVFLIFIQIIYVTMVYGPIAAFLVELFPTRIRYTSMSLPYHIGNGVFGGLVPFISTLIIEYTKTPENPGGVPLAGLWYPIGIAVICLIIGALYLTNKNDEDVSDDTNAYIK